MLPNCSGSKDEYVFSGFDGKLAGISATLIAIIGFSLNFVIILASLNYRKLRNDVTTPFILSLTTSDLLFSSLTLPLLAIRFFSEKWIMGEALCRLFPLFFYGNSAATLFSLLAVTIHRWFMIYFPDRSGQIFSRRNTKVMIVFCWVCPLLLLTPSLLGIWGHHGLECHTQSCTIQETHGSSPKTFFLLLGLLLPSVTLFIANTMIFVKVAMVRRRMAQYVSNPPSKALKKREQKLTKMMCTIFFCFTLSYYPGVIIKVFDGDETMPHLHIITYVVNWLSVIMNPVIYVISNDKYRLAIRLLLRRCCMKPDDNAGVHQIEGVRSSAMSEDEARASIRKKSLRRLSVRESIMRGTIMMENRGLLSPSKTESSQNESENEGKSMENVSI